MIGENTAAIIGFTGVILVLLALGTTLRDVWKFRAREDAGCQHHHFLDERSWSYNTVDDGATYYHVNDINIYLCQHEGCNTKRHEVVASYVIRRRDLIEYVREEGSEAQWYADHIAEPLPGVE